MASFNSSFVIRHSYLLFMGDDMRRPNALFLLALSASWAWAQDVVSYKDLKGTRFREYQMVVTIDSFDCEATIGKKCRMSVIVENKGDKPELFNGTQLSIDNGRGTAYRAVPPEGESAATLKKELQPGDSARFTVVFDGRINFDRREPAHLRYGNTSKVRIIK
jgi:hypothetical protein